MATGYYILSEIKHGTSREKTKPLHLDLLLLGALRSIFGGGESTGKEASREFPAFRV